MRKHTVFLQIWSRSSCTRQFRSSKTPSGNSRYDSRNIFERWIVKLFVLSADTVAATAEGGGQAKARGSADRKLLHQVPEAEAATGQGSPQDPAQLPHVPEQIERDEQSCSLHPADVQVYNIYTPSPIVEPCSCCYSSYVICTVLCYCADFTASRGSNQTLLVPHLFIIT